NRDRTFETVYAGTNINGYKLDSTAFALDYNHPGKMGHITLYHLGKGNFWIDRSVPRRDDTPLTLVFPAVEGSLGRCRINLRPAHGLHQGKAILHRPNSGAFFPVQNDKGSFLADFAARSNRNGAGGYDLTSISDRVFGFDY